MREMNERGRYLGSFQLRLRQGNVKGAALPMHRDVFHTRVYAAQVQA